MVRPLILATALTLCSAFTCAAQSAASSSPPDSSQSPAQPQTPPIATPAPTATPSDSAKPKRVWTDDDFSRAHSHLPANAKANSKPPASAIKPPDASYISKTKKQLDKLQADISDLDKQIVQLKNFSEGETVGPSGAVKLTKSFNRDPIPVQIQELQDKRNQLQDQIDALLDEARKKGVEPGQLR